MRPEPGGAHRGVITPAPLRGAGCTLAIDMDYVAVTQIDEVLNGEPGAGNIVAADHVNGS